VAKKRDFRREYQLRLERARARGLSRSQARGHPRAGEAHLAPGRTATTSDAKLKKALAKLRGGASLTAAAKAAGVSRERFRGHVAARGLARREGRSWIVADARARRVLVVSKGEIKTLHVSEFEAERAGRYWRDVGRFLRSNDLALLRPYRGKGVTTIDGRFVPFETDPNVLHRLASAGLPAFHEIYRIVRP
jgi:hypothetical protein